MKNQKYTGNGSTAYKTCMYAALCEDFHENEQGMNFKIQHYQTENKQKHIGFKSILYLFDSKIKIMICSYQIVRKLVKPLFFFPVAAQDDASDWSVVFLVLWFSNHPDCSWVLVCYPLAPNFSGIQYMQCVQFLDRGCVNFEVSNLCSTNT